MDRIAILLKRRAGLPVEDFQARLPPACAAIPQLRSGLLSLALPQGYRRGELLFDAIVEIGPTPSEETLAALRGPALAPLGPLLDQSRTVVMPVDVHVIKDGPKPPHAVKNIEFVNRRAGVPLGEFRAYWRNVHGPLAARIPVLPRYEQWHLAMGEYGAGREPAYDGLAVTWFASTADMRAGTTTPEYVETRADEPNFLPDGHLPTIITREHIVGG